MWFPRVRLRLLVSIKPLPEAGFVTCIDIQSSHEADVPGHQGHVEVRPSVVLNHGVRVPLAMRSSAVTHFTVTVLFPLIRNDLGLMWAVMPASTHICSSFLLEAATAQGGE